MQSFKEKVLNIVSKIPKGKVLTYQEVAEKAGSPRAFRVVGSIMKNNFDKNIPCHRVILSSGKVGEYNRGGEKTKTKILKQEGYIK